MAHACKRRGLGPQATGCKRLARHVKGVGQCWPAPIRDPTKAKPPTTVEGFPNPGDGPGRFANVAQGLEPFALRLFACQFARAADRFGFFPCPLDGGFFVMLPKLHFTKYAFALQFFLERTECLIDIVVAYLYLHKVSPPFRVIGL